MELRDYLRIIRRRWLLITLCTLVVVGAAAGLTYTATPQYASTAQLNISTPESSLDAAYQGTLTSQQKVQTYATLITGTLIAQRVIDKLDLKDESAKALAAQVSSSVDPETTLLNVTVTDPSPGRAADLVGAIADEFVAYVPEIESTQTPIKATVTGEPEVPTSPVSPRPVRNLGLALVLGLMLGVGLAVLRDILDTTVKSGHTLTEVTGLALLGGIQYDSKAGKNPLITSLDSHAPRLESFRMLRTNLQFLDVDEPPKVFVVTSAVPGEGKSTTAINLALTLAKASQKVLLIEADLRRPRVSTYLRLEPTVGLTTVLVGAIDVDSAIQPYRETGLDVVTSGTVPPNPAELLQSQTMQTTLDKLRGRYDLIIIDAPPLLPVTDAAVLATQADGAILVVRHGKTSREQVSEASKRLESVDAKAFGAVLNMVPARGDSYGYGYGYGYGYAPDKGRRKKQAPFPDAADGA